MNFIKYFIDKDYHLIIIYVLLGMFIYELIKKIIFRKVNRKKRQETVKKLILNVIKYAIIILVSIKILSIIGIDITSVLAGLGIAGVVLGLALQDIMKDILVGVTIILEDQFDIGDTVEINGFNGTVEELGLKSTKLKNSENVIKIISNRTITEVINYSKISPNLIMAIPMSYDVETKLADKIVDKIIKRAEKEITTLTSNIELWGIDKFNVSHIDYKIQVPVKMDEQYAAKRKINRIIKEEYEKANIPVPYNIIEVKNGQRI